MDDLGEDSFDMSKQREYHPFCFGHIVMRWCCDLRCIVPHALVIKYIFYSLLQSRGWCRSRSHEILTVFNLLPIIIMRSCDIFTGVKRCYERCKSMKNAPMTIMRLQVIANDLGETHDFSPQLLVTLHYFFPPRCPVREGVACADDCSTKRPGGATERAGEATECPEKSQSAQEEPLRRYPVEKTYYLDTKHLPSITL